MIRKRLRSRNNPLGFANVDPRMKTFIRSDLPKASLREKSSLVNLIEL